MLSTLSFRLDSHDIGRDHHGRGGHGDRPRRDYFFVYDTETPSLFSHSNLRVLDKETYDARRASYEKDNPSIFGASHSMPRSVNSQGALSWFTSRLPGARFGWVFDACLWLSDTETTAVSTIDGSCWWRCKKYYYINRKHRQSHCLLGRQSLPRNGRSIGHS